MSDGVSASSAAATDRGGLSRVWLLDRVLVATLGGLVLGSIATIAIPGMRIGFVAPGLDIVLHTTTAVVTTSVAALALVRFGVRGETTALFQAAALIVLAIASGYELLLVFGRANEIPGVLAASGQASLYVSAASGLLAGAMLVTGGRVSIRRIPVSAPRVVFAAAAIATVALILILQVTAMSLPSLSSPFDPISPASQGAPGATLAGGTPLGAFLGLLTAAAFLWAAALSRRLFRRDGSIGDAYFAVGLVFAAFGQLSLVFYPSSVAGLVTNGDLLRLAFDITLLLGIEAEAQVTLQDLRGANQMLGQLRDAEVDRAALGERARLSRELHDGLAQDLWLAKLKAGRLASMSDLGPDATRLCAEVVNAIDSGLAEARQAVLALRMVGDPENSFRDLLAHYVDDFEDRFGLRTEFDCPIELPRLSVRTEAELLRIAQEALSNVARHADATMVRIGAAVEDGQLAVSIRDNGKGFDMERTELDHFGLETMRERAALVGGSVVIESRPQDGTLVRVTVPVAADRRPTQRTAS
jgi:signal transduction histidine kinase